jgi:RNA polymerase sigma-70 factor (ECF subfamily)
MRSADDEQARASRRAMDRFLAGVERQAFRIAQICVRNEADALDIVQDAMIRLVKSYSQRDESEWQPLFFRILRNRINDHGRHQTVRNRVLSWFVPPDSGANTDPGELAPAAANTRPDKQASIDETMLELERAIHDLPNRQREAFLLRTIEGLDVATTAKAMGCSTGSVKTHYSRAVHSLRAILGDHWS